MNGYRFGGKDMNEKPRICSGDGGIINEVKQGTRLKNPLLETAESSRAVLPPRGGWILELDFARSMEELYGIKQEGIF